MFLDLIPPHAQDSSFGFSTSKDFEIQNSWLSTAGSKSLMEAFCDHEELLLSKISVYVLWTHKYFSYL